MPQNVLYPISLQLRVSENKNTKRHGQTKATIHFADVYFLPRHKEQK